VWRINNSYAPWAERRETGSSRRRRPRPTGTSSRPRPRASSSSLSGVRYARSFGGRLPTRRARFVAAKAGGEHVHFETPSHGKSPCPRRTAWPVGEAHGAGRQPTMDGAGVPSPSSVLSAGDDGPRCPSSMPTPRGPGIVRKRRQQAGRGGSRRRKLLVDDQDFRGASPSPGSHVDEAAAAASRRCPRAAIKCAADRTAAAGAGARPPPCRRPWRAADHLGERRGPARGGRELELAAAGEEQPGGELEEDRTPSLRLQGAWSRVVERGALRRKSAFSLIEEVGVAAPRLGISDAVASTTILGRPEPPAASRKIAAG